MQKGTRVSWKNGSHHGTVLKVNPKAILVLESNGQKWRITPNFLTIIDSENKNNSLIDINIPTLSPISIPKPTFVVPKPIFVSSTIQSELDLKYLLIETKSEIMYIIDPLLSSPIEKKKLYEVQIQWGTRTTYRNCGWYNELKNLIQISASFKNTPIYVIKSIIWHELLHIHFNHETGEIHGSNFRYFERLYPHYTEAKKFKSEYMTYLRSLNN